MRAAIDADFNADSRALSVKLEIYFYGPSVTPLTVMKDDYLIDASWLEEGSADSSSPFGAVSSNEFSFRLFNENGIFSPTNTSSPYFSLIKAGVLVIPYIRPEDTDEEVRWEKLGEYYVTDWVAAVTGTFSDVIANDKWQQIFNSPAPNYPVGRDIPFYVAMQNVYALMGYEVEVSSLLNKPLGYSFIEGTPLNFTQEMVTGAIAFCTSNKTGTPIIAPYTGVRPVRAIITDETQLKVASVTQSINTSYDGVELTYAIPQAMEQEKLVDIQKFSAPVGAFQAQNIAFNNGPVWQITSIGLQSASVKFINYTATPWLITLSLNNEGEAGEVAVSVYGKVVGFTNVVLTDNTIKPLKISNRYVQNAEYAQQYKNVMSAFVTDTTPVLALSVRGNPLLNIGDRVQVQSLKYNLNYNGLIQRMQYTYNGALSCEMTLLNESLLQGVL